jgi:hypothetical protein
MGAPMNGPKPSAPTPGMGMPAAAPKPMGAPAMAPMGGVPAGGPKPAAPAPAAKPAQPVKAKKSKGTIAYIVISIILILGLAGVGTWGYFHFTDKLDKAEEDKAIDMIKTLFEYFTANYSEMPKLYRDNCLKDGVDRSVCDYISSMTDRYAIKTFSQLYVPDIWRSKK